MSVKKRIVVVGATSAIAEHCCRLWVEREPVDLVLVARNVAHAERIAADLRARGRDAEVRVETLDFLSTEEIAAAVARWVSAGPLDRVLIAHGVLSDQQACQDDVVRAREALEVNGVSPVIFAEAFAGHMGKAGRGTLGLAGSVAGDRGRRVNYTYGASKALLDRYAQGLQHRFAGTDIKVVLIKPGPTDTPMTAHFKAAGRRLASAESVARGTVQAMDRGTAVVYLPRKWQLIMFVVRNLPDFIFNRLNI